MDIVIKFVHSNVPGHLSRLQLEISSWGAPQLSGCSNRELEQQEMQSLALDLVPLPHDFEHALHVVHMLHKAFDDFPKIVHIRIYI